MAPLGLDHRSIPPLLARVDHELAAITTRQHDLMIAGGAAVALLWDHRRITNDIDVITEGITPELRKAILRVEIDQQLEPGWFNDAAKVTTPQMQITDPHLVYQGKRLRVYVAPAEYVLTMKLFAGREADQRDIPVLIEAAGIQSRQQLYDLVTAGYGAHLLLPRTAYVIDAAWEAYTQGHHRNPFRRQGRPGPNISLDS